MTPPVAPYAYLEEVSMDPIGAITSITAGVLRRIADAIEGPAPTAAAPIVVHIANVTITETSVARPLFGRKKE